jgi:hypothetical protein
MGRKTRYDRTVRDALQIKAEGGAISILHFDPAAAGILEQIRRDLVPYVPDALTAELYNLNVYSRGGPLCAAQGHPARQRHAWHPRRVPAGAVLERSIRRQAPWRLSDLRLGRRDQGTGRINAHPLGCLLRRRRPPDRAGLGRPARDIDLLNQARHKRRAKRCARPRGDQHTRAAKAWRHAGRSALPGQGWNARLPVPICTTKTRASSASRDHSPVKPCQP